MKLSLLARLEGLLQGLGEAAMMLLRSLLVVPTYFLRSNPFTRISEGIVTRRIFPPLLFLVLAALPLPVFLAALVEAPTVFNRERYIAEHWSRLRSLDATDLLFTVGPAVLAVWMIVELATIATDHLTDYTHGSSRSTLLYMCALAVISVEVSFVLIVAAIKGPGGTSGLPEPLTRLAVPLFARVIPGALLLALAWRLARSTWRRFSVNGIVARALATALSSAVPLAVLALAAPLALVAQDFAMGFPNRWLRFTEGERLAVFVDGSHCQLGATQLACSLVVRTATTADVLVVEILSPHVRWFHSTGQGPTVVDLTYFESLPPVGHGNTIRFKGSEQTPLTVRVDVKDVCAALAAPKAETAHDFSLRFQLRGYRFRTKHSPDGFEVYRVGGVPIPEALASGLRSRCRA
jgi:hypothetical protein